MMVKFQNCDVRIGAVMIGAVVSIHSNPNAQTVAHVTGFANNAVGELILKVEGIGGEVRHCHPANLIWLD